MSSHPGRPCWVNLVLCQLAGFEAVSLRRADPEPPSVACIICQGAYVPEAAGSVSFTFHLDCGNGRVERAILGVATPCGHPTGRYHIGCARIVLRAFKKAPGIRFGHMPVVFAAAAAGAHRRLAGEGGGRGGTGAKISSNPQFCGFISVSKSHLDSRLRV